jgi:hypothetical protein
MLPNPPMNLTVPSQGHGSKIGGPIRAAVPQVIGRSFDGHSGGLRQMGLPTRLRIIVPGSATILVLGVLGAWMSLASFFVDPGFSTAVRYTVSVVLAVRRSNSVRTLWRLGFCHCSQEWQQMTVIREVSGAPAEIRAARTQACESDGDSAMFMATGGSA